MCMCCYGALQILNLAEQEVSATMEHLLHSAHEHAVHPAAALAYLNAELDRIHTLHRWVAQRITRNTYTAAA